MIRIVKDAGVSPLTGQPDFQDVNVRRLMGIFADYKEWATAALQKMEELLSAGRYDITLEEFLGDADINYYMAQMNIS